MLRLTIRIQECPGLHRNKIKQLKLDDQSIWPLIFQESRPSDSYLLPRCNGSEQQQYAGKWAAWWRSALLGCFSSSLWRLVFIVILVPWTLFCGYFGCRFHLISLIVSFLSIFFSYSLCVTVIKLSCNFFSEKCFFPIRWSELKNTISKTATEPPVL